MNSLIIAGFVVCSLAWGLSASFAASDAEIALAIAGGVGIPCWLIIGGLSRRANAMRVIGEPKD